MGGGIHRSGLTLGFIETYRGELKMSGGERRMSVWAVAGFFTLYFILFMVGVAVIAKLFSIQPNMYIRGIAPFLAASVVGYQYAVRHGADALKSNRWRLTLVSYAAEMFVVLLIFGAVLLALGMSVGEFFAMSGLSEVPTWYAVAGSAVVFLFYLGVVWLGYAVVAPHLYKQRKDAR